MSESLQSQKRIMVFGATGYTGRQTVLELQRRGLPLAIGGRDRARLGALQTELKLAEAYSLSKRDDIRRRLML